MDRRAAARYAEALLDVTSSARTVDAMRGELDALVALVAAAPDLQDLLARPDMPFEQKYATVSKVLQGQFSEAVFSLIEVLLHHGRGGELPAVEAVYDELADEAQGLVRAEARSVVPLTPEQRNRLIAVLARRTGRRVVLKERIDPSVLAGVSVQVGGRLIDGSAAGRLARMREELLTDRSA